MVPEGWIHTTFGRHIECLTGFPFKSNRYSSAEDDIRLLRGDNIVPGGLRWRDAKLWPKNETDGLDGYHLQDGDFVIALDRTWISSGLKVAEVTTADLPCLLVQRVARIRAKDSLEQSLLRQYFSGHRFEQYVKSVQTATAVPHISPSDIKEFTVQLPPLPEQKKIAQVLSTWDQAITATERLLENSQQRKKGLMQRLLTGKKRLPGFEGEWHQCRFSEIVTHRSGNSKLIKGKLATSPEAGLYPGYSASGQDVWLDHYEHQGVAIIVSAVGSRCGKCFCASGYWSAIANTHVIFPDKNSVDSFFLNCFLNNEEFWIKGGSGQPFVKIKDSLAKKVMLPSIEEQQAITSLLSICDREITALFERLKALRAEKKALMQQLLTGKRRVNVETEAA